MLRRAAAPGVFSALPTPAHAWDFGGHMATASIAFAGIKRAHPDMIEKIGQVLSSRPRIRRWCSTNHRSNLKWTASKAPVEATRSTAG